MGLSHDCIASKKIFIWNYTKQIIKLETHCWHAKRLIRSSGIDYLLMATTHSWRKGHLFRWVRQCQYSQQRTDSSRYGPQHKSRQVATPECIIQRSTNYWYEHLPFSHTKSVYTYHARVYTYHAIKFHFINYQHTVYHILS